MARPSYQPTEEIRKVVTAMSALGCRHDDIATVLEVSPKTLRKHFRKELDRGAIEANKKVMETLFEMATSKQHVAATIFWAKTRCGMRERGEVIEPSWTGAPQIVVKVE